MVNDALFTRAHPPHHMRWLSSGPGRPRGKLRAHSCGWGPLCERYHAHKLCEDGHPLEGAEGFEDEYNEEALYLSEHDMDRHTSHVQKHEKI